MQDWNVIVRSTDQLHRLVRDTAGVLVCFGSPDCGVCASLRPKVLALLAESFPQLESAYVDCARSPDVAAQAGVFSVPAVIVYLDGREFVRRVRNFSPAELRAALQRPYAMLFA